MKHFYLLLFVSFLACTNEQETPITDTHPMQEYTGELEVPDSVYIAEIRANRELKDQEYGDTATSPLHVDSIPGFTGLNYFAPDPAFRVVAQFEKNVREVFTMATSSGRLKEFRQYGVARFNINGEPCELRVYQNMQLINDPEHKDYLFVPFTDLTTGDDTYGGGRYIETVLPEGDFLVLDFNECFNPYCHYGDGWNCPIPPRENDLSVRIEAGEKLLYE